MITKMIMKFYVIKDLLTSLGAFSVHQQPFREIEEKKYLNFYNIFNNISKEASTQVDFK